MIVKFPSIRQAVVYCIPVEVGSKGRENKEKKRDKVRKRGKRKEKGKKQKKIKELGKINNK